MEKYSDIEFNAAEDLGPRVHEVAAKLLNDMRTRGLSPGERYLTSQQAQRMLRVRKGLVDEAMRYLADQEILRRQRKSGTFVGPAFKAEYLGKSATLAGVHVLLPIGWYRTRRIPAEWFVDALNKVMPDTSVNIRYIAAHKDAQATQEIIEQIKTAGRQEGIVLVFSSHQVQQLVRDSGLPAVNYGTVYPGVDGLAQVEVDQMQTGRLATQYLASRGHRQYVYLMRDQWRQGDNLAFEGIAEALHEQGVGLDQLTVRSEPADIELVKADLQCIFAQPEVPGAFLCRSGYFADAVVQVAREHGREPGRDIDIVSTISETDAPEDCAVVRPTLTSKQQIEQMGQVLLAQALGRDGEPERRIVPVELILPGGEVFVPPKSTPGSPMNGAEPTTNGTGRSTGQPTAPPTVPHRSSVDAFDLI